MLAALPKTELDELLAGVALPALTPHTLADPAQLRAELDRVRRAGYASAVNERELGVASIAAPIRDRAGNVVAAVSIGAPEARLGAAQRRRLAGVICEAGEAVSRRLGWSPESMPHTRLQGG